MRHLRFPAIAALASVLALSAGTAPAQAHGDGEGDRDRDGHASGHGHSRSMNMTLTEEVTAVLDAAAVEVEGTRGARVGRDDDLIVITIGGHHRGSRDDDRASSARRGDGSHGSPSSRSVVTFSSDADTTAWTGFAFDRVDGVITADVDGVEDVPVLTVVRSDDDDDDDDWSRRRGGWRGGSSAELQLTEESAAALDAVVNSDAFTAGDVFATTSRCGR